MIDNKSTVKKLMKRAAPSLRESLEYMLQELNNRSLIQEKNKMDYVANIAILRNRRVSHTYYIYIGKDRRNAAPLRLIERQISSQKI